VPPISYGTMKKKKEVCDKSLKDYVDRLTTPIFNKVLQETKKNHSMVDKNKKPLKKVVTPSLYNPHNYRLYLKFTKEKFKPKEGMVKVWLGKLKNYGKEFTALGEGVRITVKKTQVEVINKLSEQQWFIINRTKAKKEEGELLSKIDKKCINSLKKFIKVYGGDCDMVILKREGRPYFNLFNKCDNKVKNEPFIDTLPSEMTFETDIVKKVYKHQGEVEFKTPMYAAQHLENSALNEFAPEIAKEINIFNMKIDKVVESMVYAAENSKILSKDMAYVSANYKSHVGMVEEAHKVFKKINRRLDQKKLNEYF